MSILKKDWYEQLSDKARVEYHKKHPNSKKSIEVNTQVENDKLELAVLEEEKAKLKAMDKKLSSALSSEREEVEEAPHKLHFLNKEFSYNPDRTPLENIELSRRYTSRDIMGARCLDLRRAVKNQDHKAVLDNVSDVIPFLRRPCDIQDRWEMVLDVYYSGKVIFNREEDEAIHTLEKYLDENSLELRDMDIKQKVA